jgi:hypothetical protein
MRRGFVSEVWLWHNSVAPHVAGNVCSLGEAVVGRDVVGGQSLNPKQASPMSSSRFLTPLIAEKRRRIAGDGRAMAEPGSVE